MKKKDDEGVEEKGRKGLNYKCQNKPKQMGKVKSWMSSRGTKEVERMGTLQVVRIQGKIATQFRKSMERRREGKGKKKWVNKKKNINIETERRTNKQANKQWVGNKKNKKKDPVHTTGRSQGKQVEEKVCRKTLSSLLHH